MAGRAARRTARALLVCLALPLLLSGGPTLLPAQVFAAPPLTPVVLVPGAGGDCAATYGVPPVGQGGRDGPGRGRRLYRFLFERGYRPETGLFWADLPDTAACSLGTLVRERLLPVLDRARRRSATGRVNVVAYGYGCLLLRHYLESPGYREDIDTVVMVSPPHHGSHTVSLARLGAEVRRHVRAPRPGAAELAAWAARRDEFADGFSWVQKRAVLVYEPLCREYIAERSIGGGTGGQYDPERAFEAWLMVRQPDLWQTTVAVSDPPLPPPPVPRQGCEEQDLSRGWFELVALSLARYRLVQAGAGQEPLLTYLWHDGYFTSDWRQMVLHYAQRAAVYLADRLWGVWCDRGDEWLAEAGARASGIDPRGLASRAMLAEDLAAVGATRGEAQGAAGLVPVNALLRRWNAVGPARRPEGVRVVTIAGSCADLWQILGRSPGSNDLWLEVDSTWLSPGRDDIYRLFRGLVAGNHAWLLGDGRVLAFIETELRGPRPWHSIRPGPGGEGKVSLRGRAEVFRPTCLRLEAPSQDRRHLRVTLTPAAVPPPGLRLSAWAWLGSREQGGRDLVEGVVDGDCVTVTLTVPGGQRPEVEVGFRLAAPTSGPDDLERLLGQRPVPVTVVVEPLRPDQLPPTGDRPPLSPPGGPTDDAGAPDEPEGPGGPGVPGGSDDPGDAAEVPLIVVQRRTKQTTLKKESLPGHALWEWSFGDGTDWRDPNPNHFVSRVDHGFGAEGRRTVIARSLDESGRLLVEHTWDVVVGAGEAPLERTFVAETVRPPRVNVTLDGPLSWIAGRPADFVVRADVTPPPYCVHQEVEFDPGERFRVLWERPGEYVVKAAVTVKTKYRIAGRSLTLRRTYLAQAGVEVRATSLVE